MTDQQTMTDRQASTDRQPMADPQPIADQPADGPQSRPTTADLAAAPTAAGTTDVAASAARPTTEAAASSEQRAPLFDEGQSGELRSRWDGVQTSFVDEPRQAVQQADALVAEVMQTLARTFASERESLESQWTRGDDVSTEDLRQALRRYRSFFDRLLSL